MENSFSRNLFNESREDLIKELNFKSGIDYNTYEIVSETLFYNRNGITSILEVFFDTKDNNNDDVKQNVAYVTKQLNENVSIDEYEKKQNSFVKYIEDMNSNWMSSKNKKLSKSLLKQFPDKINGLEIDFVDKNNFLVQFKILNRFVKRDNAGFPGNIHYKLIGYCLGRFHSSEHLKINPDLYDDYFTFLKNNSIEEKVLSEWKKDLGNEPGSKYIIGDCTLDSIQYSSFSQKDAKLDSLCIVDPLFLENRYRGEDFGVLLASLGRDLVDYSLRSNSGNVGLRDILGKTFRSLLNAGKEILNTYHQVQPGIKKISHSLSTDFFLGTTLLQFSALVTEKDDYSTSYADILLVLGTQFLLEGPFKKIYKK